MPYERFLQPRDSVINKMITLLCFYDTKSIQDETLLPITTELHNRTTSLMAHSRSIKLRNKCT